MSPSRTGHETPFHGEGQTDSADLDPLTINLRAKAAQYMQGVVGIGIAQQDGGSGKIRFRSPSILELSTPLTRDQLKPGESFDPNAYHGMLGVV